MTRAAAGLFSLALVGHSAAAHAMDRGVCLSSFEVGQEFRDRGRLRAAREKFVLCAHDSCPAAVRKDCTHLLATVEADTPSVVFAARDPDGLDVVAVRVYIDDELVASKMDGRPIPLDPGPRQMRFEPPSGPTIQRTIVIRTGERNRLVTVNLGSRQGPTISTMTPPPLPYAGSSGSNFGLSSLPTPTLVFGGVGILALGTSAYMGLSALSDRDNLRQQCNVNCPREELDSLRQKLVVGDIAVAVGIASLAAATYFWLTRPSGIDSKLQGTTSNAPFLGLHF